MVLTDTPDVRICPYVTAVPVDEAGWSVNATRGGFLATVTNFKPAGARAHTHTHSLLVFVGTAVIFQACFVEELKA